MCHLQNTQKLERNIFLEFSSPNSKSWLELIRRVDQLINTNQTASMLYSTRNYMIS